MKKILVVLLVLAVAGGVFAQGSFRLSGNVEIGTRLNFNTDDSTSGPNAWKPDRATARGIGYNWWDAPRGQFQIRYVNEGLNVGLRFNTRAGGSEHEPFFSYAGENFTFKTGLFGNALLTAGTGANPWDGSIDGTTWIKWLWGQYQMLDGLIDLHVAYKSEEYQFDYWTSDTTAGAAGIGVNSASGLGTQAFNHSGGGGQNGYHHNFFGTPATFTYVDQSNYLLARVNLDAINFGIMIPYLFGNTLHVTGNEGMDLSKDADNKYNGGLVNGVLKETIFGVKFSMSPVEFAAQVKVDNYGVYFGGKFFAGPVTAGLSFSGLLNPDRVTQRFIKIGGRVDYSAGVFGAGLMASLERHNGTVASGLENNYDQLIRVQPTFFYNAIPTHLSFKLDAGFYFFSRRETPVGGTERKDSDMTWAVEPQLFWTFLGTGARNSYGWAGPFYMGAPTGMIVRYRVASEGANKNDSTKIWSSGPIGAGWTSFNSLDVVFSWNF